MSRHGPEGVSEVFPILRPQISYSTFNFLNHREDCRVPESFKSIRETLKGKGVATLLHLSTMDKPPIILRYLDP